MGEIAQQYLKKGSKVYIEGSLRTRQWTDQNGQERYSTEIRGDQLQMLDSRPQQEGGYQNQNYSQNNGGFDAPRFNNNSGNNSGDNQGGYNNNPNYTAPAAGGYAGNNQAPKAQPQQGGNEPDDDLPF